MGFARGVLSANESRQWSTRFIDKHLGQGQLDISKYLRDVLLITTNNHWDKDRKQCKEYILNNKGYHFLYLRLTGQTSVKWDEFKSNASNSVFETQNVALSDATIKKENILQSIPYCIGSPERHAFDKQVVNEFVKREYGKELEALEFKYEDKADRLWHGLQSVKREHKKAIMAEYGLKFHYDIEACAPTLLHQYAINECELDEYLFGLQSYLRNKSQFRSDLARDSETDVKTIKVLINALFSGAKLGHNPEFQLSKLLQHDKSRIEFLKNHDGLNLLRDDIKTMWTYIEEKQGKRYALIDNKQRKLPMTSKRKWNVYFRLERQVLDAVRSYLTKNNIKHFLEHDGWATDTQLDTNDLIQYIASHTGFNVLLDEEVVVNDCSCLSDE